jgi:hypothetical protein
MIRNRIKLCLIVPFFYPWRVVQAMLGFPVDVYEVNREIRFLSNYHDGNQYEID